MSKKSEQPAEDECRIRILPCTCKHKWQDRVYGKGNRVFNLRKEPDRNGGRCTVCGSSKQLK